MSREILSFDEFWKLLKAKGYQYGFDAADNAYMGYKFALEITEPHPAAKNAIRSLAATYEINNLPDIGREIRAAIGE